MRWEIAYRTTLAVVGAYIASSLVAAALARVLPGDRAEASLTGMMTSFAVFPAVVMYVFAVRRVWVALAVIGAACAVLGAFVAWSISVGGLL